MKKLLLSAITALAFLFGFASCGLTDLETEKLYLAGDMNSYTNGGAATTDSGARNTFTKVNENTQTYKFIYHNDMAAWGGGNGKLNFKVCYDESSWKLDWGWKQDIPVSLVVNDTEWLELEHRDSANSNPGNIVVEDLLDGEEYTIEVDYDAPATSVKIKIYGNKPDFPSLRFVVENGDTVKEIPLTRNGVTYSGEFASDSAGKYSGYLTNGYLYWGGNGSFATDKSGIDLIDFEIKKDEAGNVKMCYINVEMDPAKLSSIKGIEFSDIIDTSILGAADIAGVFDNWSGSKLIRVNDTTYTFDFTNNAAEMEFAIREKAGSWNVGRWFKGIPADTADRKKTDICDDITAAKKGATPVAVTPIYYKGDAGEDGQNLKITGLPYKTGYKFRLTATIVDADNKKLSLTVQALDDIPEADYVKPDSLYKADGIAWICSNYGNYEIAWGEKKADGSYEGTVTIPAGASETWSKANVIEFGVTNNTAWGVKYVDGVLSAVNTPVKLNKGGKDNNQITGVTPSEKAVVITVISTEDSISVKYSQ